MLHQFGKFRVNVLELGELIRKHRLDVSRAEEDTFEVNVSALHIDPVVKGYSDLL